jgi:hypothetical protein
MQACRKDTVKRAMILTILLTPTWARTDASAGLRSMTLSGPGAVVTPSLFSAFPYIC